MPTLPPSPDTNSSDKQKAEARARYRALRHLSNADAAAALGLTVGHVAKYRAMYPDVAPAARPVLRLVVVNDAPAPKPPKHRTRSVTYGGTSISLPREPFVVPR